jgi:predicted nucleic acid-binding protein
MIVLDCSAAVGIIRGTFEGKALQSLLLSDEIIVCPQLFYAELINAFSKYYRAGIYTEAQVNTCVSKAIQMVDYFVDMSENYVESLTEGLRLNHSTYDMFYFTLARRNAATLFTLDQKLVELCEANGVDCVHLVAECSVKVVP